MVLEIVTMRHHDISLDNQGNSYVTGYSHGLAASIYIYNDKI